ncbi:hypothetical protein [Streptomyces sp. NPDC050263]
MPSVVGLSEQRAPGARRRVDGLREDADRVQAGHRHHWPDRNDDSH